MSRSYKKHGYMSICSSYGDKYCRQLYHQSERAKAKRVLRDIVSEWVPVDDEPFGDAWKNEACLICKDCSEDCLLFEGFWGDVPYDKYMDEDYYFEPNICYNTNGCDGSYNWELSADKLFTGKGIDYSIRMSDRWSWASDGGSYFRADKSVLRQEFDEGVFGIPTYHFYKEEDIWERYEFNRNAKHNTKHPQMILRFQGKTKRSLDYFLKKYPHSILALEENCFNYWEKKMVVPYNKKHEFDNSLIPEGTYHIDCWKLNNRDSHHLQRPKYDIIDFAIDNAPLSLWSKDNLLDWLRAHQEELISKMFRRRFGK